MADDAHQMKVFHCMMRPSAIGQVGTVQATGSVRWLWPQATENVWSEIVIR